MHQRKKEIRKEEKKKDRKEEKKERRNGNCRWKKGLWDIEFLGYYRKCT